MCLGIDKARCTLLSAPPLIPYRTESTIGFGTMPPGDQPIHSKEVPLVDSVQ